MDLLGKKILIKLKTKNKGNIPLVGEIEELIKKIETSNWKSKEDIQADRPDADQVHSDGFYFFDINVHRTLILVEFDDDSEATVVWAGTHQEYESTFKNNKAVIKKWLSDRDWI
jgi:mRNA interferase HigB